MLWQPIPPGIALVTSRAVAGLDWHVRASCQPRWAVGARSTSSWSGFCAILSSSVKTPVDPPAPQPLPPPPPLTSSSSSSTYYCNVCLIREVAPLPLVSSLLILFIYLFFCCFSWSQSVLHGLASAVNVHPDFFRALGKQSSWRTLQQSLQCCLFVCLCVALVKAVY